MSDNISKGVFLFISHKIAALNFEKYLYWGLSNNIQLIIWVFKLLSFFDFDVFFRISKSPFMYCLSVHVSYDKSLYLLHNFFLAL